jgi:hypothetical protein
MHSPIISPGQVKIGDAASFVGITPRAIRHYHQIGLLPSPSGAVTIAVATATKR